MKPYFQPGEADRMIEELQDRLFNALFKAEKLKDENNRLKREAIAYKKCIAELASIVNR